MGVVNTLKACRVLEIKIISWPIPIWCGVKSKLEDKNSKGPIPLSSIVNEGSKGSTYSLTNFSPPFISLVVTMVTWTCMVKIWTCKGTISKHVPPLSGLIGLILATSCTTNVVVSILLLVLISTYTKLRGLYLKLGKVVWYTCSSSW